MNDFDRDGDAAGSGDAMHEPTSSVPEPEIPTNGTEPVLTDTLIGRRVSTLGEASVEPDPAVDTPVDSPVGPLIPTSPVVGGDGRSRRRTALLVVGAAVVTGLLGTYIGTRIQ